MNVINELEPGILKNFRFFTGVRLALVISSLLYLSFLTRFQFDRNLQFLILFVLIDTGLLFAYLSIPLLVSKLKKLYLPVAIIWATLGPMFQVYLGFQFTQTDLIQVSTYFTTPLPFLVMFIPLVIVSWQYNHRYVFLFCVVTFVFDFVFSFQFFKISISAFITLNMIAFTRTIIFLLVGTMITNLIKIQREQRDQLRRANELLVHHSAIVEQLTISHERNRMARELHDLIAHTLSGVAIELEGLRAMLAVNPEQANRLLDHSLLAIREGLSETRRALKALRSSPLDDLGLALSIRNLVDTMPNHSNYMIDMHINNDIEGFSLEVEHCFYRVAQEALNNIVSHAQATAITVSLTHEGSMMKMSIQDNGVGFNIKTINQSEKFGLLGMQERAWMIGGLLNITSNPKQGTIIELIYGAHE